MLIIIFHELLPVLVEMGGFESCSHAHCQQSRMQRWTALLDTVVSQLDMADIHQTCIELGSHVWVVVTEGRQDKYSCLWSIECLVTKQTT